MLQKTFGRTLCPAPRFNSRVLRSDVLNSFSTTVNSSLLHRDVFVYDHSFSHSAWKTAYEKGLSTKHPSSGHVIAKYSSYLHNHSKYHFNSLGEFSLIFASVIPLPPQTIALEVEAIPNNSQKDNQEEVEDILRNNQDTHSVLIHPDGLTISNLSMDEIPMIVDLIQNSKYVEADSLRKILPNHCTVSTVPGVVIVGSSGKHLSVESATQVLHWFKSALKEKEICAEGTEIIDVKKKGNGKENDNNNHFLSSPLFLLASELGGHRNSTSFLFLPSEDSFEFVSSEENARNIIKNCYNSSLDASETDPRRERVIVKVTDNW